MTPKDAVGLDVALSVLHDRGVVNQTALETVCLQLLDQPTLTLDHLVAIFGVAPMFKLVAIAPDVTARQQLREAQEAIDDIWHGRPTRIDLRDLLKAIEALLGPLPFEHPKDAA